MPNLITTEKKEWLESPPILGISPTIGTSSLQFLMGNNGGKTLCVKVLFCLQPSYAKLRREMSHKIVLWPISTAGSIHQHKLCSFVRKGPFLATDADSVGWIMAYMFLLNFVNVQFDWNGLKLLIDKKSFYLLSLFPFFEQKKSREPPCPMFQSSALATLRWKQSAGAFHPFFRLRSLFW